jgi:hypothetical protein
LAFHKILEIKSNVCSDDDRSTRTNSNRVKLEDIHTRSIFLFDGKWQGNTEIKKFEG